MGKIKNALRWGQMGFAALWLQGCGEAPSAKNMVHEAPSSVSVPLLRKPPSLASTIYDIECQTDADCTLVPQGDVCRCAGFGAMRLDNEDKFLQRRARLGARCPGAQAPTCTPDAALYQARCQNHQCAAVAPPALACVDASLPNRWPVHVALSPTAARAHDDAFAACPAGELEPEGDTQTFLLHPDVAGKYRIVLSDSAEDKGRTHWLVVRTPDCQSDNVACRICQNSDERCLIDEVLGAGDTAVIAVRNCDGDCTLHVGQFDPTKPLVPPL